MSGGRVWLTRLHSRTSARRFAGTWGVTSRKLQVPFMSLTQLLSRPLPEQSNTLRSNMRWAMERSRADDTSRALVNDSILVSPACDVDAIGCNAHIDTTLFMEIFPRSSFMCYFLRQFS